MELDRADLKLLELLQKDGRTTVQALSEAIRTSHANVSDAPAPAATPLTPATTGFGRPTIAWINRL